MQSYVRKTGKSIFDANNKQKKLAAQEQTLLIYAKAFISSKNKNIENPSETIISAIKLLSKFKKSCWKDIEDGIELLEGIDFYLDNNEDTEMIAAICRAFQSIHKKSYIFVVHTKVDNRSHAIIYISLKHQRRFINFINTAL